MNAAFDVLVSNLTTSKVGFHTMWNEHFGIVVVEYMVSSRDLWITRRR